MKKVATPKYFHNYTFYNFYYFFEFEIYIPFIVPMYVRSGAILPMLDDYNYVGERTINTLTFNMPSRRSHHEKRMLLHLDFDCVRSWYPMYHMHYEQRKIFKSISSTICHAKSRSRQWASHRLHNLASSTNHLPFFSIGSNAYPFIYHQIFCPIEGRKKKGQERMKEKKIIVKKTGGILRQSADRLSNASLLLAK